MPTPSPARTGRRPICRTWHARSRQRIESIKALGGPTGEGRLLVLAALLMADELHDTAIEMRRLRPTGSAAPPGRAGARAVRPRRMAKLARKAEDIAASLEQP